MRCEATNERRRSLLGTLDPVEAVVMTGVSVAMVVATVYQWWSFSPMEVAGFITGGVCVWLTVREHVATWPIGLANNVAFFALFWQDRLFADAWLQVVYLGFGVYGWWSWLYGGSQRTELRISRATSGEWIAIAAAIPTATWALREILIEVQGAAPFWDSLTTVTSLAAQYLMCRKRLEHWWIWMVVDIIYIPLYVSRDLSLTAVLYAVFFLMCVIGWRQWSKNFRAMLSGTGT